jgi:hypothetical protein
MRRLGNGSSEAGKMLQISKKYREIIKIHVYEFVPSCITMIAVMTLRY